MFPGFTGKIISKTTDRKLYKASLNNEKTNAPQGTSVG